MCFLWTKSNSVFPSSTQQSCSVSNSQYYSWSFYNWYQTESKKAIELKEWNYCFIEKYKNSNIKKYISKRNAYNEIHISYGDPSNGCQDRQWTMYPPISISIIANFLFSHAMPVVDWRPERIIISDVICLISLNWLNWHKKYCCVASWLVGEFQTAVCYDERKYWLEIGAMETDLNLSYNQ